MTGAGARSRLAGALVALAGAACGAAELPATRPAAPEGRAEAALGPARYALTGEFGVLLDERVGGEQGKAGEDGERADAFALAGGVRVALDAGVVVASARGRPLRGFARLPRRLGGGYAFWSEDATFAAGSFLAPLTKIAEDAAVGGVRPWLSEVLLRTEAGLLAVDPRGTRRRRIADPAFFDGVAVDGERAARVDALGRASVTFDAGAHWVPQPGLGMPVALGASEAKDGEEAWLRGSSGQVLRLLPSSSAPAGAALVPREARRARAPLTKRADVTASPAGVAAAPLAPPPLADAVSAGVLLPGGRTLAARGGTLTTFSALSGRPLASSHLPASAPCWPVNGPTGPELACVDRGAAYLLRLGGTDGRGPVDATLAATFPGARAFVAAEGGALAALGGCGPEDPALPDVLAARAAGGPRASRGASGPEPLAEPARACVRASDRWLEHALGEDETRALYRWVPEPGGRVTALLFDEAFDETDAPPEGADGTKRGEPKRGARKTPGGLRVLRLPSGGGLPAGGRWPALRKGSVDGDFWVEPSGAIRGWVLLPARPGVASPASPAFRSRLPEGAPDEEIAAGVRVDVDGRVRVLPLPIGAVDVVRGGRFALAFSEDGAFESTDGGETWRPVEAPPVPRLRGAEGGACSPAGCVLGGGLLRLGWGGPAPRAGDAAEARPEPEFAPSADLALRCAPSPEGAGAPGPRAAPGRGAPAVFSGDGAWARLPEVGSRATPASALPVLAAAAPEVGTALLEGGSLFLAGAGGRRIALGEEAARRPLAAARVPGASTLAFFTPERGGLVLLELGEASAPAPLAHFPGAFGPPHPTLTLGLRLAPKPALALVGHLGATRDGFAAELDLARASAGPLVPLAPLDGLVPAGAEACVGRAPTHLFVAPVTASLDLPGLPGLEALGPGARVFGRALVEADAFRACALAVDLALPGGAELSVSFVRDRAALRAPRGDRPARPLACAAAPRP